MRRRDIKIIIVPILIFFVFLFGIIGYRQVAGPEFSLAGAIYSTLFFFILNNISLADATSNIYLLIARYLAALMLGFGVYSLLYRHLNRWVQLLKVKYTYKNHVIVFSAKKVGWQFISDLTANGYQVVVVETAENDDIDKTERKGVVILKADEHTTRTFDALLVSRARACVLASDDDSRNIDLALKLIKYLRGMHVKRPVRLLMHIEKRTNLEAIRDHVDISNAGAFDLELFNVPQAAARKIYDDHPPHNYFDPNETENAIAVVGYSAAAEDFLLENIMLSHYNGNNLRIYLADRDADARLHEFSYQYPFFREFVDIVPVKMLNNKFFANFNLSKELIEKLSKVKAAYLFGEDGSELMNTAVRFRQFLAGQRTNYLAAPIIVCFPEDTEVMSLLDAEREGSENLNDNMRRQLNVSFVNMRSDTCTADRLLEESEYIDMLSRMINYYYAIKYEFAAVLESKYATARAAELVSSIERKMLEFSGKSKEMTEESIEDMVLDTIAGTVHCGKSQLKADFGIAKCWHQLSYHKKSANRYAARHLSVKINIMKNIGCMPITHENILNSFPIVAPIEHKRWSAEKMVLNYRYGALPADRVAKESTKERMKIHDHLVPYDKLPEAEKEKDLNLFLLIPLLNSLKMEKKK